MEATLRIVLQAQLFRSISWAFYSPIHGWTMRIAWRSRSEGFLPEGKLPRNLFWFPSLGNPPKTAAFESNTRPLGHSLGLLTLYLKAADIDCWDYPFTFIYPGDGSKLNHQELDRKFGSMFPPGQPIWGYLIFDVSTAI